jgi:hypothetical protein
MKLTKKPDSERRANPAPQDIVQAYQDVLKDRDKFGIAVPLSKLPYSKTEIKAAILSTIPEIQDAQALKDLRIGYTTLAEFIPDEKVAAIGENWSRAADAECDEDTQAEASGEAEVMEEVVRIQKGIADEGALLLKEIDQFLTRL